MTCKFVSTTEPRVVSGRHSDPCACDDRELGCLPCPEPHCVVCSKAHAKAACVDCLDAARSDLEAIWSLLAPLDAEAIDKGVQSEAMMLGGPAADPEAWQHHAMSAIRGRLCKCIQRGQLCPSLWDRTCPDVAYLEDNRDEQHPLTVLGGWEQVWRDHLDHFTEQRIHEGTAYRYLSLQIGYMAEQNEPPFDEFARDLRGCRAHLENVLHDGVREQRGAPCIQCKRPLALIHGAREDDDHWECHTCHRILSSGDYRRAVYAAHQAIADRLTASELSEKLGIKASVIRVWGSRDQTLKRGRNHDGITLYDVAAVIAKDAGGETEKAG